MDKDTLLIFDFDGTLANSLVFFENIYNKLADQFGFKKLTKSEIDMLRGSKPTEVLNIVGLKGLSLLKLPLIIRAGRKEMEKEIEAVEPVEGIIEVLKQLEKRGFRMGIISSNSKKNIRKFLKKYDLDSFDFIFSAGIFNKQKSINDLLKKRKLMHSEVLYIGDEVRDITAAHQSNVKSVAVTWGFSTKEALAQEVPDFLIDQPKQLLEILKS